MSRWRYFLKRVALSVPVLFSVMTFLFIMLRLGPLSPVAARLGQNASGADVTRLREQLGLNDPLWQQYIDYVRDLMLFQGESWVVRAGQPIPEAIASVVPVTLWLGLWAIMLPLFIGIPLGFYAGLRPNTAGDYVASVSGILWLSMPNFWLAVMALAILRQADSGLFNWYTLGPNTQSIIGNPDFGFLTTTQLLGVIPVPTSFDVMAFATDIKLILPAALILGSASMAAELRIGRTAVLETVNSNYVEMAKAKGLKGRTIVWKHIFRNALVPLIPIITNEAFILIGGSVIIEYVFNLNGIGRLYFDALVQGDLPLAGSLVFLFTLVIIFLNIVQDLLYTIIDPRVSYQQ
ncbi:ABC transporter permease [Halapricum desulfuricans]|uniref:ABC-type dipeptide/oligopeptide/nickel transportsystem, permease component n=1 Tax=Halapricum desulfuricans TaxID=2841257 RepID=A0A897N2N1_9EURY|nr:ABC transporter permease [Halapricum desulfuricans]QSG05563.1 ABC-type dipeptide/oligopeptide/nickel transportsystem, permease component [Halapricum desulfuricans]